MKDREPHKPSPDFIIRLTQQQGVINFLMPITSQLSWIHHSPLLYICILIYFFILLLYISKLYISKRTSLIRSVYVLSFLIQETNKTSQ